MTVSTEVNENIYTGNGTTTVFPYQFRIFSKSDLVVQVIDLNENVTTLTLDTHYTVSGAGGYRGGNVTLMAPLAIDWRISIIRELEITQDTDLRNQGKFFAETHEEVFDRLTMLIQQVFRRFGLALRKPSSIANWYDAMGNYIRNIRDPSSAQDAATKNYVDNLSSSNLNKTLRVPDGFIRELPGKEDRKNKILAMDDNGDPLMVLPESGSAADVLIELAKPDGVDLVGGAQKKAELLTADGPKNIGMGQRSLLESLKDIKHSKDYPSLQDAIDATADKGDLIVSPGDTTESVYLGNANLKGAGPATVLKPSEDYSRAIQLNLSVPHWQFRRVGNFKIDGAGTVGCTGIGFDPQDQYAGRYNVNDVYFTNLNKGIEKPAGNIGNTYSSVSFSGCDWGYYAQSDTEMHLGSDTIYNAHWDSISTYCVYLNAKRGTGTPYGGGIGGWGIRDSIMEASAGGGIYLNGKSDCPTAPPFISNIWFEAVATSDAIQVDGVAQKPRVLKLIDTRVFYQEFAYTNNIELVNSNLITYGSRFDNSDGKQDIVIDESSTIKAIETYLEGTPGINVIVESIASQTGKMNTANLSLRGGLTRGRLYNTNTGNKLKAITFDSGSHVFTGSSSVAGTSANDGLHAGTCTQFSFSGAGSFELTESRVNIASGNWYVWGINSRLVSGKAYVNIAGSITLGDVYLLSGEWVSTFGVARASKTESASLRVSTGGSLGAEIKFSDYFVAEFSTESQALLFANSRMSLI